MTQCYDNALRLTGYAATSSVVAGGYARRATYEYFNEGALKKANNLVDTNFGQTYSYDFAGRIKSSTTGTGVNVQNETVTMYSQALGYDAFGNLTSRETDVWGDEGGFSAVYSNGRKLNGDEIYDNAGNLVSNPIATNTYDGWAFDASGRNVRTVMAWDESLQRRKDVISNLLDGDGRAVKRVDLKETWVHSAPPEYLSSTKTEYYIRSSVLGGKVLTELRENGTKKQTNVYTGDAVIAEQMSFPADGQHSTEWGFVNWKHEDPVTGSYSRKRADGSSPTGSEPLPNAELEPLGGRIPDEDPYDPTIPPPAGLRDFRYNGGDVFRPEYGCIVDGFVQEGPGLCTRMLNNGSAVQCPNNICGPFAIPGGWAHFVASAEGGRYERIGGTRAEHEVAQYWLRDANEALREFLPVLNLDEPLPQTDCDKFIASLFGGLGAVAATHDDIVFQGIGGRRDDGRFMLENKMPPMVLDRSDHLAKQGVFHIRPDYLGTDNLEVGLYAPKGAKVVHLNGERQQKSINRDWTNTFAFRWDNGPYRGITVAFDHVGGTSGGQFGGQNLNSDFIRNRTIIGPTNAAGSQQIGLIGGLGGRQPAEQTINPMNRHTHATVYKNGHLIDPRKVFCGWR